MLNTQALRITETPRQVRSHHKPKVQEKITQDMTKQLMGETNAIRTIQKEKIDSMPRDKFKAEQRVFRSNGWAASKGNHYNGIGIVKMVSRVARAVKQLPSSFHFAIMLLALSTWAGNAIYNMAVDGTAHMVMQ